jgi:hypothetical protein
MGSSADKNFSVALSFRHLGKITAALDNLC